ncbi:hypothetical protein yinte0001_9630 [Yersinia intermedia ATCC 29909]|nr:hypothetical protein yinte0001_9630 [Yersinia intermedia ATCC 29909]
MALQQDSKRRIKLPEADLNVACSGLTLAGPGNGPSNACR